MTPRAKQFNLSQKPVIKDDEKYANARARYLERVENLPRKYGKTLAYSELGYSTSGIAKRLDKTEGTVKKYFDRLENQYGTEALYARPNPHAPEVLQ